MRHAFVECFSLYVLNLGHRIKEISLWVVEIDAYFCIWYQTHRKQSSVKTLGWKYRNSERVKDEIQPQAEKVYSLAWYTVPIAEQNYTFVQQKAWRKIKNSGDDLPIKTVVALAQFIISEMLYLKQLLKKLSQNLLILSAVTTVPSSISLPRRKVSKL